MKMVDGQQCNVFSLPAFFKMKFMPSNSIESYPSYIYIMLTDNQHNY